MFWYLETTLHAFVILAGVTLGYLGRHWIVTAILLTGIAWGVS
jgi:hypothetical protein